MRRFPCLARAGLPAAVAFLLLAACSDRVSAPSGRHTLATKPSLAADPAGPPDAHDFGPDTYSTGQYTGAGITPVGFECTQPTNGTKECAGFLASGVDGTRIDFTLDLPQGSGPFPLVVLLHGWAGSKTGDGDVAAMLVGDGDAVLRYSARGFGESWGQANLADQHVELADLRSLVGQLVDRPNFHLVADAVAITGASYGGGQSWLAALQPTFTSPRGTPVRIRTIVPVVPWTDLLYALVPNGRPRASYDGLGSPKLSYVDGLYGSGLRKPTDYPDRAYPNYPNYLVAWHDYINATEPSGADPVWQQIEGGLAGGRSIWWQQSFWQTIATTRLPVFEVQGFTDDLFPLPEAARMVDALRAIDPTYPITLYLGDIGHPRAANKPGETSYVMSLLRQWLAYYLNGQGTEPPHQVYAAITRDRSLAFDPADVITAPTIAQLATSTVSYAFDGTADLVNPVSDPLSGFIWDPFVGEGFDALQYQPTPPPDPPLLATSLGIFTVPASALDGGAPFLIAGAPLVSFTATTAAPRVQLDARLIDVAPDGTQRLITRGTLTIDTGGLPIGTRAVTIPTYGNMWALGADHVLRIELTNLDSPYIAPSRVPSETTVSNVAVQIPIR